MDNTNLINRLGNKVQALQEMEQTTLVPMESDYSALNSNTLEIIQENLKNQPLTCQLFDIVKSPSGGATSFTVSGLSGEETVKELTGIILDYTCPRAYWTTSDPAEGTPPACMSNDSIISTDGKACFSCPFNTFGSKDGESNAKACKESVLLFLLRPGNNILPLLVRVPVSSKVSFLRYATRLVGSLTPINSVVTRITLSKATNSKGQPYAKFNFEAVSTLKPEEAKQSKAFGQQFIQIVNATQSEAKYPQAS